MQKYKFTGHLSPLPPGVKLPLEISGEVYLAADVDAKFKEYDDDNLALSQSVTTLGARIAELEKHNATLERSNNRLRQKLGRLSS